MTDCRPLSLFSVQTAKQLEEELGFPVDQRCKMITLDPETGESNPEILRKVAQAHEGMAGVYAAVLVEGTVLRGDSVELLN